MIGGLPGMAETDDNVRFNHYRASHFNGQSALITQPLQPYRNRIGRLPRPSGHALRNFPTSRRATFKSVGGKTPKPDAPDPD